MLLSPQGLQGLQVQGAVAGELEKVTFPEKTEALGTPLVLNGMGARTATIFKVVVYVAGLYTTQKSSNAEELIQSSQVKALKMQFKRKVEAKDIKEAWVKGFEKNCGAYCQSAKPGLEELLTSVRDVAEGGRLELVFTKDAVDFSQDGKLVKTIKAPSISPALLSIWLGKEPPNESLKQGLLGKKD